MKTYLDMLRTLLEKLEECSLTQISREENQHAEVLVKLAFSSPIESIASTKIEVVKLTSINEGMPILLIAFLDNWMDMIIAYLREEKLLEDKLEARNLRLGAAKYVIIGKTFYKRGFSIPYL